MALDHSRLGLENKFLENKEGRILYVRQVYVTKSCQQVWGRGGGGKPTFHTFYTSRSRWNSTMRRCVYHTDLGQNVVIYHLAIQITLLQYSGRSRHTWAFSETVRRISKISYAANRLSLLQRELLSSVWMNINRVKVMLHGTIRSDDF